MPLTKTINGNIFLINTVLYNNEGSIYVDNLEKPCLGLFHLDNGHIILIGKYTTELEDDIISTIKTFSSPSIFYTYPEVGFTSKIIANERKQIMTTFKLNIEKFKSHFNNFSIPNGLQVLEMDADLAKKRYLDVNKWIDNKENFGYCLYKGKIFLSESHTFTVGNNEIFMLTLTNQSKLLKGFGTIISQYFINEALSKGYEKIYCWCNDNHEFVRKFAMKLGFETYGSAESYYIHKYFSNA